MAVAAQSEVHTEGLPEGITKAVPIRFTRKPKPVCPVHGYPMRIRSTLGYMRYCYCPAPGCKQSAKQVRGEDEV